MSTETRLACPQGNVAIVRRTGGFVGVPFKSEYYCNSCRACSNLSPHYEKTDLIQKPRRSNPDRGTYDLQLGYVWSPSHDE